LAGKNKKSPARSDPPPAGNYKRLCERGGGKERPIEKKNNKKGHALREERNLVNKRVWRSPIKRKPVCGKQKGGTEKLKERENRVGG